MPIRLFKLVMAGAAGAAAGLAASMLRGRGNPEEKEKRRRLDVGARGRTGNAMILDFQDGHLSYSYEVRGSEYIASQDITRFLQQLPWDPGALAGRPAIIKYLASNPANSIVVCENWSGLLFQPVTAERQDLPPR